MAPTLLAEQADVEARLRRELTSDEEVWVIGALEEASLLVAAHCGQSFDVEVPDGVRLVTSRVAARVVAVAPPVSGGDQRPTKVGPVEWAISAPDAGVGSARLTEGDKQILLPWAIKQHVISVSTA